MDSNTTGEQLPRGRFKKGDPRINRKGRPKAFDALRALAQQIAAEAVTDEEGNLVLVDGVVVTRVESILRDWAASREHRKQQSFIETAYGKVPDQVELSGDGGPIVIQYVNDWRDTVAE